MPRIDLDILNQKQTPAFYASSLATRPAASFVGRIFIDSDSPSTGLYRDTGTTWVQIADPGAGSTGTLQQVTTNGSSTNVGISVTTNGIGIGTAIPGANILDVHGTTGVLAQLENTTTQNSLLSFRNQGAGAWSVGNGYNAGANDFIIYDAVNFLNRFSLTNTGTSTLTSNLTAIKTATYSSGGAFGIFGYDVYTIPASTNFGSGGLIFASLQGIQSFTYGGNASYQNSSLNASVVGINQIQFSSTGTITMTQAAGIRTMAAGMFQNQFLGAVNGTIDYIAGIQVLGNYKASTGILTVTNAYGLLINAIDEYSTGFNYTNKWGIYQNAAADYNFFAGKVLIGTNIPDANILRLNGSANISGNLTLGGTIFNGTYTYTMPSATGTLALTSQLGNYLPLTGGTLNGFLGFGVSPSINVDINSSGGLNGFTGFRLKYGTSSVQSLCMGQVTAGNGAWIGMSQYNSGGFWQTEGTASTVLQFSADGSFTINTNTGLTANTNYNITARLIVKNTGIINLTNVPASNAGLVSGDIYQTAGVLMIVP